MAETVTNSMREFIVRRPDEAQDNAYGPASEEYRNNFQMGRTAHALVRVLS